MDGRNGLLAEVTSVDDARVAIERVLTVTRAAYERSSQLQHALDSRVVIEQAKGVLAERYDLHIDAAFELLRKGARSNRMPLRDLATSVVRTRRTPPEIVSLLD
jgi:AmiR/NasT family two-component response regulator